MKGLSPIIAAVMVLALSIATVVIVLRVGIPTVEEAQDYATLTEAKAILLSIDRAIREVASEGTGSTRRLALRVTDGTYIIDNSTNEVRYELETGSELVAPCVSVREGPILINTGGDVTAAERDETNDGVTDLVLENSKVMLVINKTGSPSSPVSIDTRKLILKMRIKDANLNITPTDSSIIVDNIASTSTGTGYTELIEKGTDRGRGRIRAHIESNGGINYDVVYNLFCGDYVRVEIQNAIYR